MSLFYKGEKAYSRRTEVYRSTEKHKEVQKYAFPPWFFNAY